MRTARERRLALAWSRVLRLVVLIAVLPFAAAGALPAWAELAGVEHPHICHCARDHHGCVCAKCHTDPDAEMGVSSDSLKGRCGDDDHARGPSDAPLTLFVAFMVLAPSGLEGTAPVAPLARARSRDPGPPTPPPPRTLG